MQMTFSIIGKIIRIVQKNKFNIYEHNGPTTGAWRANEVTNWWSKE